MKSEVALGVALVCSSVLSACASTPGVWNQAYGNARSSSYLGVKTTATITPKWVATLWTSAPGENPEQWLQPSAPVISPDGSIVVSGSRSARGIGGGRVRCIEPDGTFRFEYSTSRGRVSTPAVALNGRIVFVSLPDSDKTRPLIECLDHLGILQWQDKPRDPPQFRNTYTAASPPKLEGTTIFFVEWQLNAQGMFVYDLADGTALLPGGFSECAPSSVPEWAPPISIASGFPGYEGKWLFCGSDGDCSFAGAWDPDPAVQFLDDYMDFPGHPTTTAIAIGEDLSFISRGTTLETWDYPLHKAPIKSCPAPPAPIGNAPVALFADRTDAYWYVPEPDGVSIVSAVGCVKTIKAPLENPSTPALSKNHVHVSTRKGLFTFGIGLTPSGLSVAPVGENLSPRQPAIGSDGTVYEVVREVVDGISTVSLRAFGGSIQIRPDR